MKNERQDRNMEDEMDIFGILAMVGGLALFLYGMQVLGDGLKRTSGGRLEEILESLTSNKWKGRAAGLYCHGSNSVIVSNDGNGSRTRKLRYYEADAGCRRYFGSERRNDRYIVDAELDRYRKQQCVCTAVKAGELLTNRRYHWRDHADDR